MIHRCEGAGLFDHTLLRVDAGVREVGEVCREAAELGVAAVCVQGAFVPFCARELAGTGVAVACVVGFPLGAPGSGVKGFEARVAVEGGARELEVVTRVDSLLAGEDGVFLEDLAAVVEEARAGGAIVKAILETAVLDEEEMRRGTRLALEVGCGFVKTSTGFGAGGATEEAVRVLVDEAAGRIGVKASGGIRSAADVRRFVSAGATRIGSSATARIVADLGLLPG